MRKTIYAGIIIAFFCSFLCSCTTTYSIYSKYFCRETNLKEELRRGLNISECILQMRDSVALLYGLAEYKMGNLENAGKWIREAKEKNRTYLRVKRLATGQLLH